MTWELYIDGHQVNLPAFGTDDFPYGRQVVRRWQVMLENVTAGDHTRRSAFRVRENIFDGMVTFPAGTYDTTYRFTTTLSEVKEPEDVGKQLPGGAGGSAVARAAGTDRGAARGRRHRPAAAAPNTPCNRDRLAPPRSHATTSQPDRTTLQVTTRADDMTPGDQTCSLREAIQVAYTNTAVDGCLAGSADATDRIILPAGTSRLARLVPSRTAMRPAIWISQVISRSREPVRTRLRWMASSLTTCSISCSAR